MQNSTLTKKPHVKTAITAQLTVLIHPDRTDDFTDELEALVQKYAGSNYTLNWQEK